MAHELRRFTLHPKSTESTDKKKSGCFGRLLRVTFVIAALAIIGAVAASMLGGDDATHTLHGHVRIMNSANFEIAGEICAGVQAFSGVESGATMTVTMRDGDPVEASLAEGFITEEGNCQLDFTVEVEDGEWATFAVASQSQDQRIAKNQTEDAVPGADPSDWWVSVQYDVNEE